MVGLRILVVEDNRGDFVLLQRKLRRALGAPFGLRHASTITEALAALASETVDLIITDLGIPDSPELPCITFSRVASGVPILVVSGSENPATRARALETTGVHVLDKDTLTEETLASTIAAVVPVPAARPSAVA